MTGFSLAAVPGRPYFFVPGCSWVLWPIRLLQMFSSRQSVKGTLGLHRFLGSESEFYSAESQIPFSCA